MENLPKHLEKILRVTEREETYLSGQIVCECGCKSFGIKYYGDVYHGSVSLHKVSHLRYGLTVKAVCSDCKKEWLLFDYGKHSYNGLICGEGEGVVIPDSELVTALADNEREFEIGISVEFDDEEQFTEEVVDEPPEGMSFVVDDRFDIWSWLVIDLKCSESGRELKDFVNIELS